MPAHPSLLESFVFGLLFGAGFGLGWSLAVRLLDYALTRGRMLRAWVKPGNPP